MLVFFALSSPVGSKHPGFGGLASDPFVIPDLVLIETFSPPRFFAPRRLVSGAADSHLAVFAPVRSAAPSSDPGGSALSSVNSCLMIGFLFSDYPWV